MEDAVAEAMVSERVILLLESFIGTSSCSASEGANHGGSAGCSHQVHGGSQLADMVGMSGCFVTSFVSRLSKEDAWIGLGRGHVFVSGASG